MSKNEELCIKNKELCFKNEELCIKNEELCNKNDDLCRPPGGPSLGWHQDGWYWDEDVAYENYPVQLFAMYYLTDTQVRNFVLKRMDLCLKRWILCC